MTQEELNKIAIFRKKEVRKIVYKNEWWFVITDVVAALTESPNPTQYLKNIRNRDTELNALFVPVEKGVVQIEPPLALTFDTPGGPQKLLCWNTEGLFRLIQSIPSPKAEPFKRWLAKVGYERVQEIDDPELGMKRTRAIYRAKGRSEDWIENRMRGIVIREELTDEWKNRGAVGRDYEILTAEISKATFGVTPAEYKKLKGLERQNLRDHMDDFELIFNMLGERSTTEIHRNEDSKGVSKLKADAKAGGDIAGGAREKLEKRLGRPIVSKKNFLDDKPKKRLNKNNPEGRM
ncbi:MAG: Bro-N domain-containing protein [Candidatus Paceibacterota bacterium]